MTGTKDLRKILQKYPHNEVFPLYEPSIFFSENWALFFCTLWYPNLKKKNLKQPRSSPKDQITNNWQGGLLSDHLENSGSKKNRYNKKVYNGPRIVKFISAIRK